MENGDDFMLDRTELDSRLFDGFAIASRRRYVYLCNMETGISRWSRNAVEDFGLPGEYMEDAGLVWAQHIHPEDREAYLKDIEAVFAGKKSRHDMDYRACNKDGEYVICTCRGNVLKGQGQEPDLFIGSIENHGIMDNVDAITNLYNIYEFAEYISRIDRSEESITILMVSINNFSEINDTYGYAFGNKVLREFGYRVRSVINKKKDMLFRMDGVRFACCLRGRNEEEVKEVYQKIQEQGKYYIYVDGIQIAVTVSGGAVNFSYEYDEISIQTSARYALDQSKHNYHGELVFFEKDLLRDNRKNLEIMNAIRSSIVNNCEGFYLCYQPIVDAKEEKVIGAEALLRWKMEPFGEVPPGIFIPWLENDPSFWELGIWILKRALKETQFIIEKNPEFIVNVNLAYPQLANNAFTDMIKNVLAETGFPAKNLCLELTERCRHLEQNYLCKVIYFLKKQGIKVAIDDFGTGFASLELLTKIPVDTLKIDRGFIFNIQRNFASQAIVKAVTECAKEMKIKVCMEGLEERDMIDFVKKYPVHSYQGYYFSKPIIMERFVADCL